MNLDLRLIWKSLQRTRGMTVVMVLALSLGIGTWYAQRQIFAFMHALSPPAPAGLYHVALERGAAVQVERPWEVEVLLPSILLTARDAQGLAAAQVGRRVLTFGAPAVLQHEGQHEVVRARYATRELFDLFGVPLVAGRTWDASNDAALLAGVPGDEAVISARLAQRWFGGDAIGKRLRVDGADVRIVGVVGADHYGRYHLYERFVSNREEIFLPLAHATAAHAEPEQQYVVAGQDPGYVSLWVELPTERERAAFIAHVDAYLARERGSGAAEPARTLTLRTSREVLALFLPAGSIMLWPMLTMLCVLTCIVNLVRMLMVKFSGRQHELGLLRAFGARRRAVIGQLLGEALLIGLIAGVLGVVVGVALMPIAMGSVSQTIRTVSIIDVSAVVTTIVASVGAALVAALYPAWRLARGAPVRQLRSSR